MQPQSKTSVNRQYLYPSIKLLYGVVQEQGMRDREEDAVGNFGEECFVIADGVGGLPHGEIASALSVETALWAYKLVRQRHFYWKEKELLLKRIFRSTNIRVWQKQREPGFEKGLASTLVVCIVGPKNFWVGSVGDSSAFLARGGMLMKLTSDDVDEHGFLTKVIGQQRYGLVPQIAIDQWAIGDTILLATDGVTSFVPPDQLLSLLRDPTRTREGVEKIVRDIIACALENGSTDNVTAVVIRWLGTPA